MKEDAPQKSAFGAKASWVPAAPAPILVESHKEETSSLGGAKGVLTAATLQEHSKYNPKLPRHSSSHTGPKASEFNDFQYYFALNKDTGAYERKVDVAADVNNTNAPKVEEEEFVNLADDDDEQEEDIRPHRVVSTDPAAQYFPLEAHAYDDDDVQSAYSHYTAASYMTSMTQSGKYKKSPEEEIADLFANQEESISRGVYMSGMDITLLLAHLHRNTIRHLIIEDPLKNRVFTDQELFFVAAALKNGNSSVVSLQIIGCEGICSDESLIALFEALERHPVIRSVGIRNIVRCRRMQDKLTPTVIAAIEKLRAENATKTTKDSRDSKKRNPPFVYGSNEINKCTMVSSRVDPPPCISEVGTGAALCRLVCRNPSIIHVELGRQIALGVTNTGGGKGGSTSGNNKNTRGTISSLATGVYIPPKEEGGAQEKVENTSMSAGDEGSPQQLLPLPEADEGVVPSPPQKIPPLVEPPHGTLILTEEHEELLHQAIEHNMLFSPYRSAKDNSHDASLLRLLLSAEDRAALLEQQIEAVNPFMFDAESGQLAPHVMENLRREFERDNGEGGGAASVAPKRKIKKKKGVRFGLEEGDVVRPVCPDFMSGACRFGSRCKYLHPEVVVPAHMLHMTRNVDEDNNSKVNPSSSEKEEGQEEAVVDIPTNPAESVTQSTGRSQLRGRTAAKFTLKKKHTAASTTQPLSPEVDREEQPQESEACEGSIKELAAGGGLRSMLWTLINRVTGGRIAAEKEGDGAAESKSDVVEEVEDPRRRRRIVLDTAAVKARVAGSN